MNNTLAVLLPYLQLIAGPSSGFVASKAFDWLREGLPKDRIPAWAATALYAPRYARFIVLIMAAVIAVGASLLIAVIEAGDVSVALDAALAGALAGVASQLTHAAKLATEPPTDPPPPPAPWGRVMQSEKTYTDLQGSPITGQAVPIPERTARVEKFNQWVEIDNALKAEQPNIFAPELGANTFRPERRRPPPAVPYVPDPPINEGVNHGIDTTYSGPERRDPEQPRTTIGPERRRGSSRSPGPGQEWSE